MKNSIDKRVSTAEFLLTYFPSPNCYYERFPLIKNSGVLEERLKEIRKEMGEERAKNNLPPLTDEEWAKIAKNAYPVPDSTLAVSAERYRLMKDSINKAVQGTGVKLEDSHLAIIIKNMDGYVALSRILRQNKQL